MDPLTHALLGGSVAHVLGGPRLGRFAALLGGLAGELPDADMFLGSLADRATPYELHRHFTHSLFFVPINAALATAPFLAFKSVRAEWRMAYGVACAASLTHGLLDTCTTYGTRLIWPASEARLAWDLVSIIDPVVTLVLLIGLALAWWRRTTPPARVGVALALSYLTFCAWQHIRASEAVDALAEARGHAPERSRVIPGLGNAFLWRSLYAHDGGIHADALRLIPWRPPQVQEGDWQPIFVLGEEHLRGARDPERIRFLWRRIEAIADGWLVETPPGAAVAGDARYAAAAGHAPLWGWRIEPGGRDEVLQIGFGGTGRVAALRRHAHELLTGDGYVAIESVGYPGTFRSGTRGGPMNFKDTILALALAAPLAAQSGQILTFNNGAEPETLDPALMTGVPEHTLAIALFEGLTSHDPKTLAPVPGIAKSWTLSEDGRTYTFALRNDSYWVGPKGEKLERVKGSDFVYAWRRAVTPATAAQYAYQLYPVKNAQAIASGELKPEALGITAPDDDTVIVELHSPCAYFLDLTSFETLMPVHPPTLERFKSLAAEKGDPQLERTWSLGENIVSNGPYRVLEWKTREHIRMGRNPHYWNAKICKLDEVIALPLEDLETAYNRFLDGRCDWLRAIPQPKIEEIKLDPDYFVQPYLGTYFYGFNVTRPPFDDVRVRKAFNCAVNKADICSYVLRAGQVPATGFVPPGIHGYPSFEGLAYDSSKARALLAEAGYSVPGKQGGKPFPVVELLYNTSEQHKLIAEAVAKMWEEALGVTVSLRNTEWKVYLDTVDRKDYQVARRGWIGDYVDPNTFLDMFVTNGGNNNTGWGNARYDELISLAARELDPAKRFALFQEAERILCVDEMPVMPIYYYVNQGMLAEYVTGIEPNIRDLHPFQYIAIDEDLRAEIQAERKKQ